MHLGWEIMYRKKPWRRPTACISASHIRKEERWYWHQNELEILWGWTSWTTYLTNQHQYGDPVLLINIMKLCRGRRHNNGNTIITRNRSFFQNVTLLNENYFSRNLPKWDPVHHQWILMNLQTQNGAANRNISSWGRYGTFDEWTARDWKIIW